MTEYVSFWWSKFLVDLSIIGVLLAVCFAVGLIMTFKLWFKQRMCKHKSYRENMACHAICRSCDKDLGFIQNQRDKNPEGEV